MGIMLCFPFFSLFYSYFQKFIHGYSKFKTELSLSFHYSIFCDIFLSQCKEYFVYIVMLIERVYYFLQIEE